MVFICFSISVNQLPLAVSIAVCYSVGSSTWCLQVFPTTCMFTHVYFWWWNVQESGCAWRWKEEAGCMSLLYILSAWGHFCQHHHHRNYKNTFTTIRIHTDMWNLSFQYSWLPWEAFAMTSCIQVKEVHIKAWSACRGCSGLRLGMWCNCGNVQCPT